MNITQPTNEPVDAYIARIPDDRQREDARQLLTLMRDATGTWPTLWGPSIVGFGSVHYKYDSGREGDTMAVGFSARKAALVIYGVLGQNERSMAEGKLGTYKLGKGCLYIQHLDDVNRDMLKDLIARAYTQKMSQS